MLLCSRSLGVDDLRTLSVFDCFCFCVPVPAIIHHNVRSWPLLPRLELHRLLQLECQCIHPNNWIHPPAASFIDTAQGSSVAFHAARYTARTTDNSTRSFRLTVETLSGRFLSKMTGERDHANRSTGISNYLRVGHMRNVHLPFLLPYRPLEKEAES
jgi:hypothetical protein